MCHCAKCLVDEEDVASRPKRSRSFVVVLADTATCESAIESRFGPGVHQAEEVPRKQTVEMPRCVFAPKISEWWPSRFSFFTAQLDLQYSYSCSFGLHLVAVTPESTGSANLNTNRNTAILHTLTNSSTNDFLGRQTPEIHPASSNPLGPSKTRNGRLWGSRFGSEWALWEFWGLQAQSGLSKWARVFFIVFAAFLEPKNINV